MLAVPTRALLVGAVALAVALVAVGAVAGAAAVRTRSGAATAPDARRGEDIATTSGAPRPLFRELAGRHGLTGQVIAVGEAVLMVQTRQGRPVRVRIDESTAIRRDKRPARLDELAAGDGVGITGRPGVGQSILARAIVATAPRSTPPPRAAPRPRGAMPIFSIG